MNELIWKIMKENIQSKALFSNIYNLQSKGIGKILCFIIHIYIFELSHIA